MRKTFSRKYVDSFLFALYVDSVKVEGSTATMSNPNGLLSQKLYHYLNQGRTLNDISMRAAD